MHRLSTVCLKSTRPTPTVLFIRAPNKIRHKCRLLSLVVRTLGLILLGRQVEQRVTHPPPDFERIEDGQNTQQQILPVALPGKTDGSRTAAAGFGAGENSLVFSNNVHGAAEKSKLSEPKTAAFASNSASQPRPVGALPQIQDTNASPQHGLLEIHRSHPYGSRYQNTVGDCPSESAPAAFQVNEIFLLEVFLSGLNFLLDPATSERCKVQRATSSACINADRPRHSLFSHCLGPSRH